MKKLLIIPAALLLALGVSVAILMFYGGASPVTAAQVVTRMEAAQARVASSVGPNTTFHQTVRTHYAQDVPTADFYTPPDTVRDTWVAFDGTGTAHGSLSLLHGLDGTLYQRGVTTDTSITDTDIATGHTNVYRAAGPITSAALAQSISDSQSLGRQDLAAAGAAATTTTINGSAAYVLTFQANSGAVRVWVDATSYLPLRYEYHTGTASGPITRTEDVTAFEVLPGDVVPPVSGTPAAPADTTTPVATATDTPAPPAATATNTAVPALTTATP